MTRLLGETEFRRDKDDGSALGEDKDVIVAGTLNRIQLLPLHWVLNLDAIRARNKANQHRFCMGLRPKLTGNKGLWEML